MQTYLIYLYRKCIVRSRYLYIYYKGEERITIFCYANFLHELFRLKLNRYKLIQLVEKLTF